jgi:DNA-binding beta-propeller fold protein YncE
MRISLPLGLFCALAAFGQIQSGPSLPYHVVKDWAQLPKGWNFGECSGVDVDKNDNVWVFNRGAHPVVEFDKNGNMLQAWTEVPVKSSHGIRVDSQGNVWLVDVKGHALLKCSTSGRVLNVIAQPGNNHGNNDSRDAFYEPTGVAFAPNGDFFVSDGYQNSRVVKFNQHFEYLKHWGTKGSGDGEFNLVHDVCLDRLGRVYVADRTNQRVQIFDQEGRFLGKWTDLGSPWGLRYVERENAIYISDGVNDRVIKVNLDGQVLGVLGSHGKMQGQFDFPHNLTVDSTGAIYVSEIKNWRVQKFVAK